jgi:hypothetical protein
VTGTDPGAYTTAFVVRHVESALGAAAATDIAQLQISSVPSSMVNGSERVWLYDGPHGPAERLEEFSPKDRLSSIPGVTTSPTGRGTLTAVAYSVKIWYRKPFQVQTTAASPWGCRVSMIVSLQTLRPRPYGWIPPPTCRCGW